MHCGQFQFRFLLQLYRNIESFTEGLKHNMGCTSTLGIFLDLWRIVCGASRIPLPNNFEASRNSPNSPRKALRDIYSRLYFQIPWHNRGTLQHLIKLSDYEHISQRRVCLHEAKILFLACENKSVILNFGHVHPKFVEWIVILKIYACVFFYQHNTKAGGVCWECCNSKRYKKHERYATFITDLNIGRRALRPTQTGS